MSHITRIKTEVKDLTALRLAGEHLGGQFHEDQKHFVTFGGTRDGVSHALSFPNADYQVGVAQNVVGTYDLLWDSYSRGGLVPVLGQNASKLRQEYAAQAVIRANAQQGIRLNRTEQNGVIRLEAM